MILELNNKKLISHINRHNGHDNKQSCKKLKPLSLHLDLLNLFIPVGLHIVNTYKVHIRHFILFYFKYQDTIYNTNINKKSILYDNQ